MSKKIAKKKQALSPIANGPYLSLAVLCENVLEDKDGVLSLVRLVEHFKIQARSPISGELVSAAAMPYFPLAISFQLVIGLKAGKAKGRRKLTVIPRTPSGKVIAETTIPITMDTPKEPRGCNIRIPINLMVKEEGIYWIDALLNDEMLTRIPLRVEFQTVENTGAKAPGS